MENNPRSSHSADFNQFSKFLRHPQRQRDSVPCNSSAPSSPTPAPTNPNESPSLAMVYPISQKWQSIYDPEIALMNGTIFEQLNKPFYPTGCARSNGCRGNTSTGGTRR